MNALLAGFGAFCGGTLRYWISQAIPTKEFPAATVLINLSGSLLLGIVAAVWSKEHPMRLLLGVGFLGGYTTFSTFSLEILEQLKQNQTPQALLNVLFQVVGGVLLCAFGYWIGIRMRSSG